MVARSVTLEGQGPGQTVLDADGRTFLSATVDVTIVGAHIRNIWTQDSPTPGLYLAGGAAVLRDVLYADVTTEYYRGHTALLVGCGTDCSVTLDRVEVTDLTGVHTRFEDSLCPPSAAW